MSLQLEDVQRTALEQDQNFVLTLFVMIAFVMAWLPIIVVHFIPASVIHPADTATIKFALIWLAIGGQSSKWLIYMFTNSEFRKYFCIPCLGKEPDDYDDEETIREPGCCRKLFCAPCLMVAKRPNQDFQRHSLVIPQPVQRVSATHMARATSMQAPPHSLSYSYYPNGRSESMGMGQPFVQQQKLPEYGSFARIPVGFWR